MNDDQKLINAIYLCTKYAERTEPLPEHEVMAYLQLTRWVEQTLKLQNLKMEVEIRRLEGEEP